MNDSEALDLAVLSTRIFTGSPRQPWAKALGVKDSRIVALGSNQQIQETINPSKTTVLELPGRLVVPGLVDAHCHFGILGRTLLMLDLGNKASLAACRQSIAEETKHHPPGQWILGHGWNQFQWKEGREPTVKDIDNLTPKHPAMMTRACGHTVWVNSVALRIAGINRETPDPPGGRIERDPNTGEPNGLLREASGLIERVLPKPSVDEWKKAILASQEASLGFGLTRVHTFESIMQWEAMQSLDSEGKLKIRTHHNLQAGDLENLKSLNLKPGSGSDRLWVGHIKLFADGTLGSGTALLHDPYSDDSTQSGIAVTPIEVMTERIALAYDMGFDVAIHSIGDKATTHCLKAIEAGRQHLPNNHRSRDCIEHVQLFRKEDIPRFLSLGAVASVQPVFLHTDWSVAENRWGYERCRIGGYAWRTLMAAGIPIQFGSDSPVESINPVLGLQAAVARQTLDGNPKDGWFSGQKLTLAESLAGFSKIAAWTARKEDSLGAIAPGKLADLTVFASDLFHHPPHSWPSIGVEVTIVDGEIVYHKS